MDTELCFRQGTVSDLSEILLHRRRMCEDMGYRDEAALDAMVATSGVYLEGALKDGSFRSWLAVRGDRVVGGGAVLVTPWPSHVFDAQCRRAIVLNVYVYPEFRRQGIARKIMDVILAWCRKEGFANVYLHASDEGRHLYETLGFEPTNEMRLNLR